MFSLGFCRLQSHGRQQEPIESNQLVAWKPLVPRDLHRARSRLHAGGRQSGRVYECDVCDYMLALLPLSARQRREGNARGGSRGGSLPMTWRIVGDTSTDEKRTQYCNVTNCKIVDFLRLLRSGHRNGDRWPMWCDKISMLMDRRSRRSGGEAGYARQSGFCSSPSTVAKTPYRCHGARHCVQHISILLAICGQCIQFNDLAGTATAS